MTSFGKRFGILFLLFFVAVLNSCSKISTQPEAAAPRAPMELTMSQEVGHFDITKFRYHSSKTTLDDRKIKVKREEIVEFKVRSEVLGVTPEGHVKLQMRTMEKDGPVDLRDLAYPEINEMIDFLMTKKAKVLKASEYPKESIFFVQPIPLPEGAVKEGDTWSYQHTWLGRNNGVPLKLDLVAILSKFVSCGLRDTCAEIEISGSVELPRGLIKGSMSSNITGRLLFAVNRGLLVWSEIRTLEDLKLEDEKIKVASCMESVLEVPTAYIWMNKKKPYCTPTF